MASTQSGISLSKNVELPNVNVNGTSKKRLLDVDNGNASPLENGQIKVETDLSWGGGPYEDDDMSQKVLDTYPHDSAVIWGIQGGFDVGVRIKDEVTVVQDDAGPSSLPTNASNEASSSSSSSVITDVMCLFEKKKKDDEDSESVTELMKIYLKKEIELTDLKIEKHKKALQLMK